MNEKQIIQVIKEELQKVLKEGRFSHFGNYGSSKGWSSSSYSGRRAEKGDSEKSFIPDQSEKVFITVPTEFFAEYPTGGPGRPHKLYTGGPVKPELKGKSYAERAEIWKASDPEWGEWYDKNMAILDRQAAGENVRPDVNFRNWSTSYNTFSRSKQKK
jgi:hypothetical protein